MMGAVQQTALLDRIAAMLCVGGGAVACNGPAIHRANVTFGVTLRGEDRFVALPARLCPLHAPRGSHPAQPRSRPAIEALRRS
jgi:hypothetical protein